MNSVFYTLFYFLAIFVPPRINGDLKLYGIESGFKITLDFSRHSGIWKPCKSAIQAYCTAFDKRGVHKVVHKSEMYWCGSSLLRAGKYILDYHLRIVYDILVITWLGTGVK